MHLPLLQLRSSLGLEGWRTNGFDASLVAAAHPSGALVAVARASVLTVLPLLPGSPGQAADQGPDHGELQQAAAPAAPYALHHSKHTYTALAWFVQLQARRGAAGQQQQQQNAAPAPSPQQQQQPAGQPRCSVEAYESLLESEVLLSGTTDGHLQIHGASGQLLFKQRLSGLPVVDIIVRPHCSGLSSSEAGEEVCVCFSNALVRINSLDLRAQVRMLQLVQGSVGAAAAGSVGPLPSVRYDLPAAIGPRVSGLSFGPLPTDLYALLSSGTGGPASSSSSGGGGARPPGKHKVCIVTVGRNPCMAAFDADEHPSRSTLAALVGMASSLTSGVMGAASKVAGLGPSIMYKGVRSLVSRYTPAWVQGAAGASGAGGGGPAQPVISYDDLAALPKPEALSLTRQLRDDGRVLEGLVPAPLGALLVAPDNLGRVLLLDGADMVAVRIWKGYRDAQCGWLLPPPGHSAAPLGLLLVLHAPKRQVLEVLLPRSGQRLASRVVDSPCLLLNVGLPCGAWGNQGAMGAWLQLCGSATTLVVNMLTGEAWDAMECLMEE